MSLPCRPPLVQEAITDLTDRAFHGATCLAPAMERAWFAALLDYVTTLETQCARHAPQSSPAPVPANDPVGDIPY